MTLAHKILVVDDSPTTGNLMQLHLANLGYRITAVASSADEALRLIEHDPPDLVLMDINLGEGMNGIEAADIIMNQHKIPVIYVTAYSDEQTLNSAKKSLPYGFINKPFRENDLRVNIEIALGRLANEQIRNTGNKDIRDITDPDLEISPLSEALDHLASGVVLVNEKLEVFYKNKSASNILDEKFPIRIKDNCLACANSRIRKDIQKLVDSKVSTIYSLSHGHTSAHLLIFPLNTQLSADVNHSPGSVLFVFNTAASSTRLEEVVRTMYKLSPTEARIAARLVYNPYLADISASLGITHNTARTHLKRIYQKTGTNKLPSLIQKIVTGPAGLLIHSAE